MCFFVIMYKIQTIQIDYPGELWELKGVKKKRKKWLAEKMK